MSKWNIISCWANLNLHSCNWFEYLFFCFSHVLILLMIVFQVDELELLTFDIQATFCLTTAKTATINFSNEVSRIIPLKLNQVYDFVTMKLTRMNGNIGKYSIYSAVYPHRSHRIGTHRQQVHDFPFLCIQSKLSACYLRKRERNVLHQNFVLFYKNGIPILQMGSKGWNDRTICCWNYISCLFGYRKLWDLKSWCIRIVNVSSVFQFHRNSQFWYHYARAVELSLLMLYFLKLLSTSVFINGFNLSCNLCVSDSIKRIKWFNKTSGGNKFSCALFYFVDRHNTLN